MLNKIGLLFLFVFFLTGCETNVVPEEEFSAEYEVNIAMHWDSDNFSTDYPSNPHFSKLIGWSHSPEVSFFEVGTFASAGIVNMAERGDNTQLRVEINEMIAKAEGLALFEGSGLGAGTGDFKLTVEVDTVFSSITLATMLAPSPDWYVALVNLNLRVNRAFITDTSFHIPLYDAGSDSGESFTSANKETVPRTLISYMVEEPLGNGGELLAPIATVSLSKK